MWIEFFPVNTNKHPMDFKTDGFVKKNVLLNLMQSSSKTTL